MKYRYHTQTFQMIKIRIVSVIYGQHFKKGGGITSRNEIYQKIM